MYNGFSFNCQLSSCFRRFGLVFPKKINGKIKKISIRNKIRSKRKKVRFRKKTEKEMKDSFVNLFKFGSWIESEVKFFFTDRRKNNYRLVDHLLEESSPEI